MRRTDFLSVETTINYLFFKYYPVENRLQQRHFLKKSYVWATWSFYINPILQKIHRCWIDNVEIIDCRKAWHWKWRPSFYDSWVRHFCSFLFWNKFDHKKYGYVLVLYLFRDISSFKLEKGDDMKLSRTGFLYKQKKINTCTTKLREIHS